MTVIAVVVVTPNTHETFTTVVEGYTFEEAIRLADTHTNLWKRYSLRLADVADALGMGHYDPSADAKSPRYA